MTSIEASSSSARVVILSYFEFHEAMSWLSSNKHEFSEFVLDNVPLVKTFTSNVQNKVLNVFNEREFKEGEYLMKTGERSSSLYLIVDGECALYTTADLSTNFIPLKLLGEEE